MMKVSPNFPAFYQSLRGIRRKIVDSREDRQNRDTIYESIENVDLKALVSDFEDIVESESVMVQAARRERLSKLIVIGVGGIELVVIVVGIIEIWIHRQSLF